MMRDLRLVAAISRVTATEILRDRILYNLVVFAALLLALSFFAGQLTVGQPERSVMNIGLAAILFALDAMALLLSAGMLGREFERRTIHLALCRPVTRVQFVAGKLLGLVGVLALAAASLSAAYLGILALVAGGQFGLLLSPALAAALVLAWAQASVLAAVTLALSSFTTASLATGMGMALLIVGNQVSQLRIFAARLESRSQFGDALLLKAVASVVPNFEHFSLATSVTYALPLVPSSIALAFVYAASVCAICVVLAGWFSRGKES